MDRSRSGAEETDVSITPPKTCAVGVPAVANPAVLLGLPGLCLAGNGPPSPAPQRGLREGTKHVSNEATSGGEHDHPSRLLERTTSGATGATATAPRSNGS